MAAPFKTVPKRVMMKATMGRQSQTGQGMSRSICSHRHSNLGMFGKHLITFSRVTKSQPDRLNRTETSIVTYISVKTKSQSDSRITRRKKWSSQS